MHRPVLSCLFLLALCGPICAASRAPLAAPQDESRGITPRRSAGDQGRGKAGRERLEGKVGARANVSLGIHGRVVPQPQEVVLADSVLHDDREGTAQQRLLRLVGSPVQGFLAAWNDGRDGIPGLYMGRLAPNGLLRGGERPVRGPAESWPELEPALALANSGVGAVAWLAFGSDELALRLRILRSDGSMSAPRSFAQGQAAPDGRSAHGHRQPALVVHEVAAQGLQGSVYWLDEGRVLRRSFRPNGEFEGEPLELNARAESVAAGEAPEVATLARGQLHVAAQADGSELAVWPDARGIAFAMLRGTERKFSGLAGRGAPLRVAADPEGGWWLLAHYEGDYSLRHLDPLGAPDRSEVGLGGPELAGVDLAISAQGVYLLTQASPGHADRRRVPAGLELRRLDPEDTSLPGESVAVLPASVAEDLTVMGSAGQPGGALLASSGTHLLVAFTARATGDHDIYYRTFDARLAAAPGPDGEELQRWNRDQGCSDQSESDIAADGGDYAVTAWTDHRSGKPRVMARLVSSRGSFLSREIEVPAEEPEARPRPTSRPAVALGAERSFLVTFHQERGENRLYAQVFDSNGVPRYKAQRVDIGHTTPPGWAADAVALPGRDSYVVVFVRTGEGPALVELNAKGKVRGEPLLIAASPSAARPAVCRLDDGRVVVAWDELDPRGTRVLRVAAFRRSLSPIGDPQRLPWSVRQDDWGASLAPADDGGWGLAFTAGQTEGRGVFVHWFDKLGRISGGPRSLTPALGNQESARLMRLAPGPGKGGWVVAWVDDLSGAESVHFRRITPRRKVGPIHMLHQQVNALNKNRAEPRVAPVSTGLIGLWTDCRRSRGADVYVRVVGHEFDVAPAPSSKRR